MQPNTLDKFIGYLNPAWAAKRLRARAFMAIAGGYIGARYDRNATKTWYVHGNSADVDSIYDLPTLRARSRDLIRNAPLAIGALGTVTMNVVGRGLTLQALPDAEAIGITDEEADKWKDAVEREFRLWAESPECDITRTQNFYQLQGLVFRAALESGDCFSLLPMIKRADSPYSLRVQVIEADRVENPGNAVGIKQLDNGNKIAGGVELDANGAPVAYHISSNHPGEYAPNALKFTRVPAFGAKTGRRNVLHIFDRTRPGQTRGIPYLAPVIEPLKMLDRYTEAELMAAVISGMFTVFVKSESGEGLAGFAPADGTPSSNKATDVRMGNGSIVDLAPGEDVQFANPGRPSTSFDPFVQAVLRQVGVALGLPFEVLIKHFTASYSAARAALLQAWQFFNSRRDFLASIFCTPIYEAWLEEAVALGRIDAPGFFDDPAIRRAYLQADWIGDAPSSIDPEKEVNAAKTRIEIGVSDLAHETLQLTGRVWDDVNRQQEKERKARIASGLEVAAIPTQPGGTPTVGQEKTQQAGTGQPAPAQNNQGGSDLENGGNNAGN